MIQKKTTIQRPARILALGADGADPKIVEAMMDAGRLPHLSRLRRRGLFGPMTTTFPAVSPTAWTSILTGRWPAGHGVLDFIIKAPGSYHPALGLYSMQRDESGKIRHRTRRSVPMLSDLLGSQGRRSCLLHVPGTFPAPQTVGAVLAGFGAPDIMGTFGIAALYVSDRDRLQSGIRARDEVTLLTPAGDGQWRGMLQGPGDLGQPFLLTRLGRRLVISYSGPIRGAVNCSLLEGEWSPWLMIDLSAQGESAGPSVSGVTRFCLLALEPDIVLFRSPIHHAPESRVEPLCWPSDLGGRLASQIGPFPTGSFLAEQSACQDGLLPPMAFLAGAYAAWETQRDLVEMLLEDETWDFALTHFFTLDSLQHLFWEDAPFGGEIIAAGYEWIDQMAGRFMASVGSPETAFFLLSDHGVSPVRRWAHLNTWLREEGYLIVDSRGRVNWGQTLAFCLGYGGIYINVVGRDPQGQVEPGRPYENLRQELIHKLESWRDPTDGRKVIERAGRREEWHQGPHLASMPDLPLAFAKGFALSREDARGELAPRRPVIETNLARWKAGHEGPYLPERVPGTLLAAGPGIPRREMKGARVVDVAPTVLALLGMEQNCAMDGLDLIGGAPAD